MHELLRKMKFDRFYWILLRRSFIFFLCIPINTSFGLTSFNTLLEESLTDPSPFSFRQFSNSFSENDFTIQKSSEFPFKISILPGSLQWVRIQSFDAPRVTLQIQLKPNQRGTFILGSLKIPLLSTTFNKVLMPLLNDPGKPYYIELIENEDPKTLKKYEILLKSSKKFILNLDHSCNPYQIRLQNQPNAGFLSLSCELILNKENNKDSPLLKLNVLSETSFQTFLLSHFQNEAILSNDSASNHTALKIVARVSEKFKPFQLSLGVGPYKFNAYDANGSKENTIIYPTLYASYFLKDSLRFVSFIAVAPTPMGHADIGGYAWVQQFKTLADRVSLQLLLGVRTLIFKDSQSKLFYRMSLPQGVELLWKDFLLPQYNASAGAFFSPPSDEKSYTNIWIRYGTRSLFVEFNYLHWKETVYLNETFSTQCTGLSVGFPLFK